MGSDDDDVCVCVCIQSGGRLFWGNARLIDCSCPLDSTGVIAGKAWWKLCIRRKKQIRS